MRDRPHLAEFARKPEIVTGEELAAQGSDQQ